MERKGIKAELRKLKLAIDELKVLNHGSHPVDGYSSSFNTMAYHLTRSPHDPFVSAPDAGATSIDLVDLSPY